MEPGTPPHGFAQVTCAAFEKEKRRMTKKIKKDIVEELTKLEHKMVKYLRRLKKRRRKK